MISEFWRNILAIFGICFKRSGKGRGDGIRTDRVAARTASALDRFHYPANLNGNIMPTRSTPATTTGAPVPAQHRARLSAMGPA
jgi:hypothetical protein